VSGPSVIRGAPWLLFYRAAGAIGVATSDDGHRWTKIPGTTLTPDQGAEGDALGPPAAVRLGASGGASGASGAVGARVRVYYPARGALFAAEADLADFQARRPPRWTRLDGDPATPGRDPMLAGAPFALALERVTARAAETPVGRLRHDLYFTARVPSSGPTATTATTTTTIGFAASYTGDRFLAAAAPILPRSPAARGPTETPYRDGALLLYVGHAGARDAILAARSP